jgi:hypothetical protein
MHERDSKITKLTESQFDFLCAKTAYPILEVKVTDSAQANHNNKSNYTSIYRTVIRNITPKLLVSLLTHI